MAEITLEQRIGALDVALVLDAMVGRLSYDRDFADAITRDPRTTLADAGMIMDKQSVEELIRTDPERFDRVSEALCAHFDADFFASLRGLNSCD